MKFLKAFFYTALILLAQNIFSADEIKITEYNGKLNIPALDAPVIPAGSYDFVFDTPEFLAANWTEGDFRAGDTTATYDVSHASVVYLVYVDSALTGTDSLWFGITNTLSNGLVIDAPVKVQNLNQTTSTTYLSGSLLIPGNNTKTIYLFTPSASVAGAKITATFKLTRLNVNDNVTPYVNVGRFIFAWE